jgi:hypothetical protein
MSAPLSGTATVIQIYPLNSDPGNATNANQIVVNSAGQYAYFADEGNAKRIVRIDLAAGTASLFSTGGTYAAGATGIFWKPGSSETVLLIYAADGKVHECPLSTGVISAGTQTTWSDNSTISPLIELQTVTYFDSGGEKVIINMKNASFDNGRLLNLSTLKFQLDPLQPMRVRLGSVSRIRRPLNGKIFGNIGYSAANNNFFVASANLDPMRAHEVRFEFGIPETAFGAVALPAASVGQVLTGLRTAGILEGDNWFVSDPDGAHHYGAYSTNCLYRFNPAADTATLISKETLFPNGAAWFIAATNKIIVVSGTHCRLIS